MPPKSTFLIHAGSNVIEIHSECQKALTTEGIQSITIHGIESAINKAIKIALLLEKDLDSIKMEVCTSSVDFVGNLQRIAEVIEPEALKHSCASVHIQLKKTEASPMQKNNT